MKKDKFTFNGYYGNEYSFHVFYNERCMFGDEFSSWHELPLQLHEHEFETLFELFYDGLKFIRRYTDKKDQYKNLYEYTKWFIIFVADNSLVPQFNYKFVFEAFCRKYNIEKIEELESGLEPEPEPSLYELFEDMRVAANAFFNYVDDAAIKYWKGE